MTMHDIGSAIGIVGLDVPVELVRAAGFVPCAVPHDLRDRRAAALLDETGGHPAIRALAARLLADDAPPRVIVSTTPSYLTTLHRLMVCLPTAWPDIRVPETVLVDLQHGDLAASVTYNRHALAQLAERIAHWSAVPINAGALEAEIARADHIRHAFAAFTALRGERRIAGTQALELYAARWTPGVLDRIAARIAAAGEPLPGIPTIYSGTDTGDGRLYAAIESAGAIIVGDDQDGGERTIGPFVGTDGDPYERLRLAYQHRAPSAARWSIAARVVALLDLVRARGARLVVFAPAVFDHPAAWDLPHQRAALDAAGVAHTTLDPRSYERPDTVRALLSSVIGTLR